MATEDALSIAKEYGAVLEDCVLFRDIPQNKYPNVLNCLEARVSTLERGTILNAPWETTRCTGVLLHGALESCLYDENGRQVTIEHLKPGCLFGAENFCRDQVGDPVFLEVVSDSQVLLLDLKQLLNEKTLTCPYRMQVTANLMQKFAHQINFLTTKIRILSQKKLRDKLKVYLQSQKISPSGVIYLPLNRNELAEFLSADRSALSRELCRMRDEGILSIAGKKITILDENFLAG